MMINGASNPLAGKLTINGVSSQTPESASRDPLGSGLKVSSRSSAVSPKSAANAAEQISQAEKKQKLVQNFEATLLARLEKTEKPGGNGNAPEGARAEEAKKLANSITATIEQIKKEFGNETANEVMANILTGAEEVVTADRIAAAIGNTLQSIANSSKPNMATASEDDLAKADETNKKLEKMLQFLNEGAAGDEGKGGSLKDNLNSFFGMADFEEDDQDRFTADFKWISKNEEIENAKAKGNDEKEFYLTLGELGKDNVDKLVNFLRNDLGDEAAAQYIETLGDDADIFEAVGELRNMFYKDSELVGYANSSTDFVLAHHEGPGMEKIAELGIFLNDNLLDEVNGIIREDDGVRNRFLDMAGKKLGSTEGLPDTYGLTGWPGSSGISGTVEGKRIGTAGGTIFNGEHSWENEFHLGDMGETTAEERNIYALKARAEGARALAETCETYREGLLAGADSLDKEYEEAMAAYKAKTAPPTAPGSMVEQMA